MDYFTWNSRLRFRRPDVPVSPKPLSPLGIAVLGLLVERPMHPYEMYQLATARGESRLMSVNAGSLYRAVHALEAQGHIRSVGCDRDGARPERTTFEVADSGRQLLHDRVRDLITTPQDEYPLFPVGVSEAHSLSRSEALDAFAARLAAQTEELAALTAQIDALTARGVPRFYWIDRTLTQATLHAEVAWLEQTLADLTSGVLVWEHRTSVTLSE
jgi:DNA-binding PadR family transcriptional regulator